PVRFRFAPDEPVTDAVRRLHLQRLEAEEFGGVELAVMTGGRPLESVLVFDNYPVDASLGAVSEATAPDHPLAHRSYSVAQTEFPVRVDVLRGAEDALVLTFAGDREAPADADAPADRWVAALRSLADRAAPGPAKAGPAQRAEADRADAPAAGEDPGPHGRAPGGPPPPGARPGAPAARTPARDHQQHRTPAG